MKRLHLIIILTIAVVLLVISIGLLISYLLNYEFTFAHIVRSTVIPMIITPITSWYLIGLLFSIEEMKEKTTILATYDDLTGLLNRRAFYELSQKTHNSLKQNQLQYFSS